MKYISTAKNLILLLSIGFLFTGCVYSAWLRALEYRSIRPTVLKETNPPADASIALHTIIKKEKKAKYREWVDVFVALQNLTDQTMTIDQTKSFYINTKKTPHHSMTLPSDIIRIPKQTGQAKPGVLI